MALSRRDFLRASVGAAAGAALIPEALGMELLRPVEDVPNPFVSYPSRDWESLYRDIFREDSSYVFMCAPNDTHNCLLRAYVKNGVVVRTGPTYGYGKATDLYGNKASARWDPRTCQKGTSIYRRFYGDRRVKFPAVRKGFKAWVDAGFPRGPDGKPPPQYLKRGQEPFVRVSWDEAYDMVAKTLYNIAKTYSGKEGEELLHRQGYDPAMVEATHGAGTQVLKFRGGMPLLGATRIFGMYRVANSMALLDARLRGVKPDDSLGGRLWDSYSWHTDLPPGHPMVTGQQTIDYDLATVENAGLVVCWGMNWISTKMPDGHWLTEARLKGTKVITVACEYQSTSNKADEVITVRPGSDPALALGIVHILMRDRTYDADFVKTRSDLPLLVRMDTLNLLRASDLEVGRAPAPLSNYIQILKAGESPPPVLLQGVPIVPEAMRKEWGDHVVWDSKSGGVAVVTRDMVGAKFPFDPALEGEFEAPLADGTRVKVRPVFDLIREYVAAFDPGTVSGITWISKDALESLARQIAANRGKVLLTAGMGPNHFFNNDLKDRAILLVAAMTGNIGRFGGNQGSFAGNYRTAYFNGLPQYLLEDPFDIQLDPAKPAKVKKYAKAESAHYWNYGDRPLRVGNHLFTGKTHVPTPTKSLWFSNGNSLLGNIKWHYDVVVNTLPKMEMVVVNDWWWTASCEYADVVLAVDSWGELKFPDMTAAVTNPFVQVFPRTPLPRIHDTRGDIETYAGVATRLAALTGDKRFEDHWRFVHEGKVEVYLQRIVDASTTLKGYKFEDMEALAKEGIPRLLMTRTYPKIIGWEQTNEDKPWYTKTGRLEFYREEPEWKDAGENLPVHREPVDGTPYEPNVIVAPAHPALKPRGPEHYGLAREDRSTEVRQVRNVVVAPADLPKTAHPRIQDGLTHVYITPKYRHGAHTTPVDLDLQAVWFGPFGDFYRFDKRMPWVGEGYVDLHPADAKKLGLEDGDYVWVDADPEDRPYRGWKAGTPEYKLSRAIMRVRYYNGVLPGIARSWFNMYTATYGSIRGHETRPDGLARNPDTNYQAMFRYGSHQSGSRAWLRPTLMTDSLVRKGTFGQAVDKGFEADIHCTVGAPKESFVKFTRAEDGSPDGGPWRPVRLGLRPTHESPAMKRYLRGEYAESL